ncbi:hypothetical protein K402DRAFT_422342 [Aulographum hederae CBS 113979]|uniref:LSM2-LSM8 complex subunit LSM8 n=1 Tax=Aulographum hederae CBS 113979 TaxID=1176131 RepID=A0A6G1GVR4_9PEZI|nr:hypothetical protein K402DRAFT_422342 [Aulographum hederae CBS 113979]
MSAQAYIDCHVTVITVDGRIFGGILRSADHMANLVLEDAYERVIQPHGSLAENGLLPQGVFILRGDSVVVCGLVDDEIDKSIDWQKVKGDAIGSTKHI